MHKWVVEQLKKKGFVSVFQLWWSWWPCWSIKTSRLWEVMTPDSGWKYQDQIAVDKDFITFGFVFCFNSKLLRPRHCLGGRICYVVSGRDMASRVVESQTLPRSSKVLRWSYELYMIDVLSKTRFFDCYSDCLYIFPFLIVVFISCLSEYCWHSLVLPFFSGSS